jgi:hypothetical protein
MEGLDMGIHGVKKLRIWGRTITPRNAAARCLVAVVNYHDAGETAEAAGVMSAEIREVVALSDDRHLTASEFVTSVLYPQGRSLANRYGVERGGLLFAAFLTCFLATADVATVTA